MSTMHLRKIALLLVFALALTAALAQAEFTQKGNLRVTVSGKLKPKRLPRTGTAPISVSVGGKISTTDDSLPPQLKSLRIELNRHGRLDYADLPICKYAKIQPGSTSRALAGCRSSLVGRGSFTVNVTLGDQEPYPTSGRLLVFNSRVGCSSAFGRVRPSRSRTQGGLERGASKHHSLIPLRSERSANDNSGERTSTVRDPRSADRGHRDAPCRTRPVLYGHIYAPHPFATSFVIVFRLSERRHGTYGTVLNAPLPKAMKAWGRLTGLTMTLSRRYSAGGRRHSYLSSGCSTPKGVSIAVFPLARTSFAFAGGKTLSSVLTSTCRPRGRRR